MPRSTRIVLAVAAAIVATACSDGTTPDTAGPTSTSASASVERTSRSVLEDVRKDPCTGLTADQAAGLDLAPGKQISDVGHGAECMWTHPTHKSNVVFIGFETFDGQGFDAVRAKRAEHAYHEEVEVGIYPAVFSSFSDHRPQGTCSLYVGVADGVVMTLTAAVPEGPDAADPCAAAKRIATTVAGNLGKS